MSIRWYALTPTGLPVYCHGEPVIFHADCKLDAIQLIVERWPGRFGLKAQSVCEYEAVEEMTSAAKRAKAKDDETLKTVMTLDATFRQETPEDGGHTYELDMFAESAEDRQARQIAMARAVSVVGGEFWLDTMGRLHLDPKTMEPLPVELTPYGFELGFDEEAAA